MNFKHFIIFHSLLYILFYFLDFIYLLLEREEGRKKEEKNINV